MSETKFTEAQLSAINHHGSDLLISAGAGSGKTATLTERIIRSIVSGADISEMLIVTFTNAAAAELKARISSKMADILSENPKNEHISSQIVKIASADICTIDSFCMKIVRQNFEKLSIDSDFRIGDESEINIIRNEAMDEVLDNFYENDSENEDFLLVSDCFSEIADEKALAKNLLKLYDKLISTRDSIEILKKDVSFNGDFMKSIYGDILKNYIKIFCRAHIKAYEYSLSEIKKDENLSSAYLNTFGNDYNFLDKLYTLYQNLSYEELKKIFDGFEPEGLKAMRKQTDIDIKFLQMLRKDFKDDLSELKDRYFSSEQKSIESAFYQNKRICDSIYSILKKFENEFQKKKKNASLCDFNDIERYALKILYDENGLPSQVAKNTRDRYREVYIDEYQDTNSIQDAIFSAVSENNRFMVGDIKQSIYRFRSAEPEIFSSYRKKFIPFDKNTEKYEPGCTIFMSENFRCDKNIINFSNAVSEYMFGNTEAIPYSKKDNLIFSKNVPEDYVSEKVDICLIFPEKKNKNDGDLQMAEDEGDEISEEDFVASEIKDILEKGSLPNGKKIAPDDIAILIRNFGSQSPKYVQALKKYGIDTVCKENEAFFEKPEILFIICILNAIDNPSHDEYLAGALCSDIFSFTLEEIIKIRQAEKNKDSSLFSALKDYSENDEISEKIKYFLSLRNEMKQNAKKLPSHEIISYIYERVGILSLASAVERKNLLKFYNCARQYEHHSFKGLYSFLKYIEKISSDYSSESTENKKGAVKIMSVHASKGLEFEVCFICNAGSNFQHLDTREPLLFDRNSGVCGYVGRKDGLVKFNTLIRKCTALSIQHASSEEEMRILYVAMTRAKSKLYITAKLQNAFDNLQKAKKCAPFASALRLYNSASYIKMITGAVYEDNDFANVRIISSKQDYKKSDDSALSEKTEKAKSDNDEELRKMFKERFDFKYQYEYLNKIPSKLSISRLYPKILDGTENEDIDMNITLDSVPKFLNASDKDFDAAQKGTATHLFMQFCNFENLVKNGVENELGRLLKDSFISKENAKLINLSHIEKFAHSDLIFDILSSKKVMREFRFNIMLDAAEFSDDENLKGRYVLTQGVCDCIYEDKDGELILVDYKTDSVTERNYIEVLKERHSSQLLYYKKALETIFERSVKKTLIYSVPLAKTVELE